MNKMQLNPNSPLILHHYAGSPFSEKLRLILGSKQLSWRSVTVPVMRPNPDVEALTGGYRRTPFLQVAGDVFCDTALICELLEAVQPEPSLFPPAIAGQARMQAQWADRELFWAAVPYTMQPAGAAAIFAGAPPEFLAAFAADRAAMMGHMKRASVADAGAALRSHLQWLESQLSDGRRFLLGASSSVADFSVAQSIWYIRRAPPVAGILAPYGRLNAWFERVAAFGHGQSEKLSSEAALSVARELGPQLGSQLPLRVEAGQGFEAGEAVQVAATDYASDPVRGELLGLDDRRISLARVDARAGRVHVHFPRMGYGLRKDVGAHSA